MGLYSKMLKYVRRKIKYNLVFHSFQRCIVCFSAGFDINENNLCLRPYHPEKTGSILITEVKQGLAWLSTQLGDCLGTPHVVDIFVQMGGQWCPKYTSHTKDSIRFCAIAHGSLLSLMTNIIATCLDKSLLLIIVYLNHNSTVFILIS